MQGTLYLKNEIGQNAISNVVEIVVDVHDARQRRGGVAIDEGIGNGVACRKAAGNRNKVADLEFARRLRFDKSQNVRNGYPGHGVVHDVATGIERGLVGDSANGGGLDRKVEELADLMLVC